MNKDKAKRVTAALGMLSPNIGTFFIHNKETKERIARSSIERIHDLLDSVQIFRAGLLATRKLLAGCRQSEERTAPCSNLVTGMVEMALTFYCPNCAKGHDVKTKTGDFKCPECGLRYFATIDVYCTERDFNDNALEGKHLENIGG